MSEELFTQQQAEDLAQYFNKCIGLKISNPEDFIELRDLEQSSDSVHVYWFTSVSNDDIYYEYVIRDADDSPTFIPFILLNHTEKYDICTIDLFGDIDLGEVSCRPNKRAIRELKSLLDLRKTTGELYDVFNI